MDGTAKYGIIPSLIKHDAILGILGITLGYGLCHQWPIDIVYALTDHGKWSVTIFEEGFCL